MGEHGGACSDCSEAWRSVRCIEAGCEAGHQTPSYLIQEHMSNNNFYLSESKCPAPLLTPLL